MTLLPPANEVWGKVMFLHLCVILCTGEEGVYPTPPGCRPPRVRQIPQGWADPPGVGQTPGWADPPWMQTPRGWTDPSPDADPHYSQQAGGTHTTGMHTC